jgi:hypothetical protein
MANPAISLSLFLLGFCINDIMYKTPNGKISRRPKIDNSSNKKIKFLKEENLPEN